VQPGAVSAQPFWTAQLGGHIALTQNPLQVSVQSHAVWQSTPAPHAN